VRGDGIGDALVCVPLIAALRQAGHTVGAVLSTRNRAALATRTFSAVHVLERIPWPRHGSTPESYGRALGEARRERYEVALIASEEIEAYAFAREAGIARRVGFVNGWEKPLKTLRVRGLLSESLVRPASGRRASEHEVETLFRLGRGLHAEAAPPRDAARLSSLVLDTAVARGERIALQVTPKFAGAGLDAAAFAALARALRERFSAVAAVSDDPEFAGRVQELGGGAVELPPPGGWKQTIAAARALVAPDSGATNLAGMLGVPCLALFAPGPHVERDMERWRPWIGHALTSPLDALDRDAFAQRTVAQVAELLVNEPADVAT
jgi:ADP-heptose:LPS heptosyltransferase